MVADRSNDAVTLHCSACGAPLRDGVRRCDHCGAEVTFEERQLDRLCASCGGRTTRTARYCMTCGIAVEAQVVTPLPAGTCPRCRAALRERDLGIVAVVECISCAGLWVAPAVFERLCSRAESQEVALRELSAQTPLNREPERGSVRYLPCPACKDLMLRRNFGTTSGVIVDLCRLHGVWLDHRELEKVLGFVRAGGLERERVREVDRLKREAALARAQRAGGPIGNAAHFEPILGGSDPAGDLLFSGLELLSGVIRRFFK